MIRALERAGFLLVRATGRHHDFTHRTAAHFLVFVPIGPRDSERPVLRAILREADLTVDAFLDLL